MSNNTTTEKKQPPVILCIGMAGSGKTTFMQVREESDKVNSLLIIFLENQCSPSRKKDTALCAKS